MKRIYVEMIADLFHYGHAEFLRKARMLGDHLTVGILSDEWAKANKTEPVMTQEERARTVGSCRYVDEVLMRDEPATAGWLRENFDINAIAFRNDTDRARHVNTSLGYDRTREVELDYEQSISTTDIIERIRSCGKARDVALRAVRQAFIARWTASEWLLAEQMLRDVSGILKDANITHTLVFGSLLGAMRHQGVIPWDDDIDLGIFEKDEQRLQELAPLLKQAGYGMARLEKRTPEGLEFFYKIWITTIPSTFSKAFSWPFLDIFIFRPSQDEDMMMLDWHPIKASLLESFKSVPFGNLTMPVPEEAEALTERFYKDFRTVCATSRFIHRHEKHAIEMTRSLAEVQDAGCFVQMHEYAKNIFSSVPQRTASWSLSKDERCLEKGGIRLQIGAEVVALWKLIDGTRMISQLFDAAKGPRIHQMQRVTSSLLELQKQQAITIITVK